MKLLLAKPMPMEETELLEYFRSMEWQVKSAFGNNEICNILNSDRINIVIFNASTVDDFALIVYINENYPDIEVIVSVDNNLGKAIENVRKGLYSAIQRPFHLSELGECINVMASGS